MSERHIHRRPADVENHCDQYLGRKCPKLLDVMLHTDKINYCLVNVNNNNDRNRNDDKAAMAMCKKGTKKNHKQLPFHFTKSCCLPGFSIFEASVKWKVEPETHSRILNWKRNYATDSFSTIQLGIYIEIATFYTFHTALCTHIHEHTVDTHTHITFHVVCAMSELRLHNATPKCTTQRQKPHTGTGLSAGMNASAKRRTDTKIRRYATMH